MRKVIGYALAIFVLVSAGLIVDRHYRLNRPVPKEAQSGPGRDLPAAQLTEFPSKSAVALKKYAGRVVLINFWASWCEACLAEMPSIQRLYDRYRGEGLSVLSVNVDDNPEKAVPPVVARMKLNFPIFTDSSGDLGRAFDVVAIPYSVVADRRHTVVWSESGERDWASESVQTEIRKLLKAQ